MTSRSRRVRSAVTVPVAGLTALGALVLAGCASVAQTSPGASRPSGSAAATTSAAPAAVGSTPSASPSASPTAAHPASSVNPGGPVAGPECTAAQLKVAYTDNAQIRNGALDGMSHADSVMTFTNVSSNPCRTRGYPGLAALDSAGHQIKQAVRGKAANGQEPLITLAPGQVASAEITGNTASCSSLTKIAAFLVSAPDQRTSVHLAGSHVMCLNSLGIDPLEHGNAGGLPTR